MRWLRELRMIINAAKTELVYFNKYGEDLQVMFEGHKLSSSNEMNVLGMTFDSKMSWEPQLKRAIRVCQRFKPAVKQLRSKLMKKEMLQVITSHYYSKLYYDSELWFHCLSSKLKKIYFTCSFLPA
jgi:hypothetical protein